MQHIHIIAVGGLKEPAFSAACKEYQKRLQAFCKLEMVELPEYRLPQNPSPAQIKKCVQEEGNAILGKIPQRAYVVAMCIEGKQMPSEQLASTLEELASTHSHTAFVIGGSHGLSQAVKQAAHKRMSMSEMTFPHQLARVMLLEQVYRAFSIVRGGKYHK